MSGWTAATATTALAAAAAGGALVVFSTFVATALRRLPAPEAIVVMQQLNLAAPRSAVFMVLLLAPALAAVVLSARGVLVGGPGTAWVVAATVVYVVGVVATTAGFHVPRNEALASWDPTGDALRWAAWWSAWTTGNHVRAVAALVSGGLLLRSLR